MEHTNFVILDGLLMLAEILELLFVEHLSMFVLKF